MKVEVVVLKAVGFEAYGAAAARSRVQLFTMTLWPSQETKKETAGEPTFPPFFLTMKTAVLFWFADGIFLFLLRSLQKLVYYLLFLRLFPLGWGKKGYHSTKVNCTLTHCVLIAGLQMAIRNDFFSNLCPIFSKPPMVTNT